MRTALDRFKGRTIVLHPFLFASFAGLSFVVSNRTQLAGAGAQTVALTLLLAALAFLVLRLVVRDRVRAGLVASAAVVLFFSYGHVLNLLQTISSQAFASAVVLLVWAGVFAGWSYLVLRRVERPQTISNQLNLIALVVNLVPLVTLVAFSSRPASLAEVAAAYSERYFELPNAGDLERPADPPDVYYLILDAYGREDVLRDLYGYDNSGFIAALRRRGFQVDDWAYTNYTHSELSMAASLNMQHINHLPGFAGQAGVSVGEDDVRIMAGDLIGSSVVRRSFERMGYTSVAFDSGYPPTAMRTADQFVQSDEIETVGSWELGAEFMLLDTTLGREVVSLLGSERSPHNQLFEAHRARVLYTLEHLADYARMDGDYFVFAHVVSPHVPFVFDAQGNPVASTDPYSLLDARGGDPANIGLYTDQLHYLNTQVLAAIDAILTESDTPPLIVVQADHGSKVYSEANPPLDIRERLFLPILNAVLAPRAQLYPGMTPVNTFRVLLDAYFGASLGMQPDDSYLLEPVDGSWQFVDACLVYPSCLSSGFGEDG